MQYEVIDQADQLARVVASCQQCEAIAVDTEFARFNTYYPMVGLIQIFDGEACYLIDPLAVGSLEPLVSLMADPTTVKVFHACSEDLEVFQHCMSTLPRPVFDTQIAAAVLGVGFSMSYQNLVGHALEIELPKDETRSDWLQRPLTDSQLEYAALDVVYLYQVYQLQREELNRQARLSWVEEECEVMGLDIPTCIAPEESYLRLKGLHQLKPQQLNVLRSLCAWREQTARDENVPRNRVADNKALMMLAKGQISSLKMLQSEGQLNPRQIRKYGDLLLDLVEEAENVSRDEYPEQIKGPGKPLDGTNLKTLRAVANEQARKLGVSPELLVKRRHLEELMRSGGELPAGLKGWREEAVGRVLADEMANWN